MRKRILPQNKPLFRKRSLVCLETSVQACIPTDCKPQPTHRNKPFFSHLGFRQGFRVELPQSVAQWLLPLSHTVPPPDALTRHSSTLCTTVEATLSTLSKPNTGTKELLNERAQTVRAQTVYICQVCIAKRANRTTSSKPSQQPSATAGNRSQAVADFI